MKTSLIALALTLATGAAFAADTSCADQAAAKKLHGAAEKSFVKKCEKDTAKDSCATTAADKKLKGAAKNSFMKKCERDAAAAAASGASK